MEIIRMEKREGVSNDFWIKLDLEVGVTTPAVLLPRGLRSITAYDVETDAEETLIETTIYPEEDILADTAIWRTVGVGEEVLPPTVAVRVTVTGESFTMGTLLLRSV